MIQVKESKNHYINATALSFGENDLGSPNRVAVSLVGGAAILVHVKGTIDYAADGNFQRWTLKGYSTKLAANTPYYIYARLDRSAPEALITFSANRYALDGSIEGDSSTAPSTRYWYVRIGQLNETDGITNRELTYDSGALGTDMEINKGSDLIEEAFVFHYDDANDPNKLTSIQAKAGLWTDYFLSAKGNNSIGTSGTGGASKLGELMNVSSDADIVHATDKILTLSAGDNLWKLSDLSDMVGLDENALFDYLTRNSYAKKSDIPSLSGYATESWVKQQGYLTQHQDLSDYAKKDDIPTNVSAFNNDANYATVSDLDNRIDALVNGAPAAYDTLKEIADVLSKNVDSIDDIITALGNKVNQSDFDDTITDINTSIDNLSKELGLKLDASIFNDLFEKVEISKGVWAIKAKLGLFSDSFISAKGSNNSGTGSTGGAVALYKLNDVKEGANAVYGATDGAVLVYDGSTGKWQGVEQSKIVPNLSGYATEQWVKQQGYLTQHQDLTGYATESWVKSQGYLTQHQDLSGYQTKITSTNKLSASLVSGLATVSTSGKYSDLSGLPTIPTSLKSPYSLTFGSKTYDGSAAKEIVASDLGALTSHQTIYALTIKNSGGTTQLTYTPNSAAGSLTLTKAMVGLGNVENTKLSTWAGTENITTLGTITTGTWNGSKIGNSYLSNSSISIAGTSVSLGSSITADTLKNNLGLGSFAYKSSLAFSDLTGKPTTISGYGITDAKIANGVITLGVNTITPLTSHQTIYNLTLQAGTFTAVTFDPNGAAKTVNIPTTTSHISEGSNLYFTNARAVSALNSTVTGINNSITTLNGYFSNGVANSAAKLTTISKTAWGQTYWTSGGVPTSISGNMTGVGSITMTGAISGVTSITASGAISTSSTISATAGIWSDGYVSAKGQNTSSDIRLKEFIKDVYLSVSDISHAPSMLFKWKSGGGFDIGSSAQYWQRLLPNAVKERNGFLEMQYANIALISAISLAKNLESHEERISRLERDYRFKN